VADSLPLAALRHADDALRSLGRAFALVGGLAVSVRSEVRFTRDVDLAVVVGEDDDAEQLVFALGESSYEVLATVEQEGTGRLATARLRGPNAVVVDLLLASSGIEAEVVEHAERVAVLPGLVLPVARVEELLALKVLTSAEDRPQDVMDFRNLVQFNPAYDEAAVLQALGLIEARGYHRDQGLQEKYRRMRSRLVP